MNPDYDPEKFDMDSHGNLIPKECKHKHLRFTIPYTICRDCGKAWEGTYKPRKEERNKQ